MRLFFLYIVCSSNYVVFFCSVSLLMFGQDWWYSFLQVHCRHNSTVSMDTKPDINPPPPPPIFHPQLCLVHPHHLLHPEAPIVILSPLSPSPSHHVKSSETWKCTSAENPFLWGQEREIKKQLRGRQQSVGSKLKTMSGESLFCAKTPPGKTKNR